MLTEQDAELFRQAVQDAKPLKAKHSTRTVKTKHPIIQPLKKQPIKSLPNLDYFTDDFLSCEVNAELFFARPDLPQSTIKNLRQGKMPIFARIDLHGMTIAQAKITLQKFLFGCQQQNIRSVLIIHGKGSGIIKSAINSWLTNYPNTLCFCSAKPQDGGTGAVYLLLSRGFKKP